MKTNNKKEFPGYPHYPAGEDITQPGNNNGEKTLAGENIPVNNKTDNLDNQAADTRFVSGTDADVTDEDISMLDAAEENMDTIDSANLQHATLDSVDDDGDPLNERGSLNMDMTGEDLDIPGSSDDDADETIGEEDEENNYYSLGGDNHEAQEENQE